MRGEGENIWNAETSKLSLISQLWNDGVTFNINGTQVNNITMPLSPGTATYFGLNGEVIDVQPYQHLSSELVIQTANNSWNFIGIGEANQREDHLGPFTWEIHNESNGLQMSMYYHGNSNKYTGYQWIQMVEADPPAHNLPKRHLDGKYVNGVLLNSPFMFQNNELPILKELVK